MRINKKIIKKLQNNSEIYNNLSQEEKEYLNIIGFENCERFSIIKEKFVKNYSFIGDAIYRIRKDIMDWEIETKEHIYNVKKILDVFALELKKRGKQHDLSKLSKDEAEYFKKYTSKLKDTTYGSEKYNKYLKELKPALEHHYKNNRHHPKHFKNGIRDMNLIDIIEMFCDWHAATKRHKDGDIIKSIKYNKTRFNYNELLEKIFKNTVKKIESDKK